MKMKIRLSLKLAVQPTGSPELPQLGSICTEVTQESEITGLLRQLPRDWLVVRMEMSSFQWEDSGIRNYRTGLLTHTVSNEKTVIWEKKHPPQVKNKHHGEREGFPLYPLCKANQLLTTRWSVRLLYGRTQGQITADKPFPAKKRYKQSKTSSSSMIQC